MPYVDGFVIPVSKDKVEAYKAQARKAGEVWKEYGALAFVECIGDDVPYGQLTSFPRAVQARMMRPSSSPGSIIATAPTATASTRRLWRTSASRATCPSMASA